MCIQEMTRPIGKDYEDMQKKIKTEKINDKKEIVYLDEE